MTPCGRRRSASCSHVVFSLWGDRTALCIFSVCSSSSLWTSPLCRGTDQSPSGHAPCTLLFLGIRSPLSTLILHDDPCITDFYGHSPHRPRSLRVLYSAIIRMSILQRGICVCARLTREWWLGFLHSACLFVGRVRKVNTFNERIFCFQLRKKSLGLSLTFHEEEVFRYTAEVLPFHFSNKNTREGAEDYSRRIFKAWRRGR